jgi:transcriptional regulator with GAF, ATPase, and Fis domain
MFSRRELGGAAAWVTDRLVSSPHRRPAPDGPQDQSPPDTPDLLSFQQHLFNLSQGLLAAGADELDAAIESVMDAIGTFMGAGRCCVMQVSADQNEFRLIHRWSADGVEPADTPVPSQLNTRFPWLTATILRGSSVMFSQLDDLPPAAVAEKASFRDLGIRAGFVVPLTTGGQVLGAAGLGMTADCVWDAGALKNLETAWHVLASALAHRRNEEALQTALTDVEALRAQLRADSVSLERDVRDTEEFEDIVGTSPVLRQVFHKIDQVAPTDTAVLLLGETGTGKELGARAIHRRSARKSRPLVTVNCATLPATLIESELFGHEKGAFTGAMTAHAGWFEAANRGTIFLDEIGDLPTELQAKLLRVLQEGEFERLGSTRTVRVDVRVIAATNCDLMHAVADGRFREDLYYRLNVFPIHFPPLRERVDDLPSLVWHIIGKHQTTLGKKVTQIPQQIMDAMMAYRWPGNVRELENLLERALIMSPGATLQLDETLGDSPQSGNGRVPADASLEDVERAHIVDALVRCGWKIKGPNHAAERLGLNPSTLRSRMLKLGIQRPA